MNSSPHVCMYPRPRQTLRLANRPTYAPLFRLFCCTQPSLWFLLLAPSYVALSRRLPVALRFEMAVSCQCLGPGDCGEGSSHLPPHVPVEAEQAQPGVVRLPMLLLLRLCRCSHGERRGIKSSRRWPPCDTVAIRQVRDPAVGS